MIGMTSAMAAVHVLVEDLGEYGEMRLMVKEKEET